MLHPAFEHLAMPEDVWMTMSERGRKDFIETFLKYDIIQTVGGEDKDLDNTISYYDESQSNMPISNNNPLMILAATASKITTSNEIPITKKKVSVKKNIATNDISKSNDLETAFKNTSGIIEQSGIYILSQNLFFNIFFNDKV